MLHSEAEHASSMVTIQLVVTSTKFAKRYWIAYSDDDLVTQLNNIKCPAGRSWRRRHRERMETGCQAHCLIAATASAPAPAPAFAFASASSYYLLVQDNNFLLTRRSSWW